MDQTSLPLHWKMVSLGEVCSLRAEAISPFISPDAQYVGLEHIDSGSPHLFRWGTASEVSSSKSRFCSGDVLYGKLRPYLDKAVLAEFDGICSTDILVLKSREVIIPEFLAYLTHTHAFLERAIKTTRGVNHPRTSWSSLAEFELLLPSLKEQCAIARVLRTVQKAKEIRRKQIQLEREIKAALMKRLFTRGARGEARKQTEIGEMPESWQVMKFAEAVEITKGQVDPAQEPYKSMPHVGPENIEPDTGRLLPTQTNGELKISSGNYLFTKDDILYSKIRPYLNKVALPYFDGTCSADIYPLRPLDGSMTREFLFHQLLSEQFKARAMSFQMRTGIPKINREQLGGISLLKPSIEEQREIAGVLNACDKIIALLEKESDLLDELFRALLEELMTGRLSATALIESE